MKSTSKLSQVKKAKQCISHYNMCDCREQRFLAMQRALINILVRTEQDAINSESRATAMQNIAKICERGLYE